MTLSELVLVVKYYINCVFLFLKRPLSSTHVFKNVLKNIMFKKESSHFPLLYLKNPPNFPEIAKCPFSLISLLFPKQTCKHPFWIIPHRVIRPRTFSQMFLIFTKHPNIKMYFSFFLLTSLQNVHRSPSWCHFFSPSKLEIKTFYPQAILFSHIFTSLLLLK